MTTPILTVQPIKLTSNVNRWNVFYQQLGLIPTTTDQDFLHILAADAGTLLLVEVEPNSPLDGTTRVEFTVPDLDAYWSALQTAGVDVVAAEIPHHRGIAVDLPHGRILIRQLRPQHGQSEVHPELLSLGALLYGPLERIGEGADLLEQYGLKPRIASDSGGWTDLMGHGLFAFHSGTGKTVAHEPPHQPLVDVFGETGDIAAYQQRLKKTGLESALVDEAYGRSLRIHQPDGSELWINETQQDLYGYHREDD